MYLNKQEKAEIIQELAIKGLIKFQTNIQGELEIVPVQLTKEAWFVLLNDIWGIDEYDTELWKNLENAIYRKIKSSRQTDNHQV